MSSAPPATRSRRPRPPRALRGRGKPLSRRASMRKLAHFGLGTAVLIALAALTTLVPGTTPPAAHERPALDAQLVRALVEARANLDATRALGAGPPRVFLRTQELDLALHACRELQADAEEQVRLLLVSRLVRDLGRACAKGEIERRLAEERLTEEDLRFLLGALEARLARACGEEPRTRPSS